MSGEIRRRRFGLVGLAVMVGLLATRAVPSGVGVRMPPGGAAAATAATASWETVIAAGESVGSATAFWGRTSWAQTFAGPLMAGFGTNLLGSGSVPASAVPPPISIVLP